MRGIFTYKYCLYEGEHFKGYERGLDRIADLALLEGWIDSRGIKHVELNDEWEQFKLNFNVYTPRIDQQRMRVAGDR